MGAVRIAITLVALMSVVCFVTRAEADDSIDSLNDLSPIENRLDDRKFNILRHRDRPGRAFGRFRGTQRGFGQDTFNRPEGTEALSLSRSSKNIPFASRIAGQYGSYKKEKYWQRAVADDRFRNTVGNDAFNVIQRRFPFLMRNLQTPTAQGFGLNGFWNSYAPPENTMSPDSSFSAASNVQMASEFPSVTVNV